MEIQIRGRDLDLDEGVRDHIARRVHRMRRQLPGITAARVDLDTVSKCTPRHRVVAQVTIDWGGATTIRGEEHGPNAMAAVDSAMDSMGRRVKPYDSLAEAA